MNSLTLYMYWLTVLFVDEDRLIRDRDPPVVILLLIKARPLALEHLNSVHSYVLVNGIAIVTITSLL